MNKHLQIHELKNRMDVLSTLELILDDCEWALPFHYKIHDPSESEETGIYYKTDDGCGEYAFVIFSKAGCIIKGFNCEHNTDTKVYENVPQSLLKFLNDPMIEKNDVTFCIWREATDTAWKIEKSKQSDTPDIITTWHATAADYINWADDYHRDDADTFDKNAVKAIKRIYAGEINEEIIAAINPTKNAKQVLNEIHKTLRSK
ncbi:MAG: hypothetical protein FWC89_01155 [Defluviitaleaceae bacterium]|nr:hypothetical protein [Defluviitaleaceae bacterium]